MEKTLRSTDIMVGDCVTLRSTAFESGRELFDNNYKIREYTHTTRVSVMLLETLEKQELGFIRKGIVGFVYIEPIPIAEQILVDKMGLRLYLKGEVFNTYLYDKNDDYEITIHEYADKWRVNMIMNTDNDGEPTVVQTVIVRYLHELQHALKHYTGNDIKIKI